MKLSIFSQPIADIGTFSHDHGWTVTGYQDTFKGRICISFDIPSGTPQGHGGRVILRKSSKVVIDTRGILWLRDGVLNYPWAHSDQTAAFEQDDFYFQDDKICPEPGPDPDPDPNPDPDPGIPQTELEVIERALEAFPEHSQRVEMLKKAARDLNFYGFSSGGRGPFGILRKQIGNNCGGYSCDIIAAGQEEEQGQWDVLINDEIPAWQGPKTVDDNIRVDICEPQLP